MTNNEKVKEFMTVFGQTVKTKPEMTKIDTTVLRIKLIEEEFHELVAAALEQEDLVEVADALTDILYVTYGFGHALGIDLDKCFDEVHSSNMSKLGDDGKPIYREDGKVLKGPHYFKPNLSKVLGV